jgi:hypothetical protein
MHNRLNKETTIYQFLFEWGDLSDIDKRKLDIWCVIDRENLNELWSSEE